MQAGRRCGRPLVDHIKGSRHHNMKELRTGTIRVFFVFERDVPLMLVRRRQARRPERLVPTDHSARLTGSMTNHRRDNGKGGRRMAPRSTKSWEVVRAELPIDEAASRAYGS